MAIRKRYELVVGDRSVLRLKPKQDRVIVEHTSTMGYWTGTAELDREAVLELRDTLDEILMSWFCPDKPKTLCPICEKEYGGLVPIVFDPADVGRLDMGERFEMGEPDIEALRLTGRERGQAMQGGVDTTHEDPDIALYGQSTEDEIEEARRRC